MRSMTQVPAIDSHHHFWDPERDRFPWMTNRHRVINRRFAPEDLRNELAAAGVIGTVLVQIGASYEKNLPLLRAASEAGFVVGVIGWVDLESADVPDQLDRLFDMSGGELLVGIRHPVCNEADPGWLLRRDTQRGLAAVAKRGLAFDLLVGQRELPAASQAADAFPEMRFVVDHLANRDIRISDFASWAVALKRFAEGRSNVWCKLSGMVTMADSEKWEPAQIHPFLLEAIRVFGPEKCMFGSDWPVCLLAATYRQVADMVRSALLPLPCRQQEAILANSAIEAYALQERCGVLLRAAPEDGAEDAQGAGPTPERCRQ